MKDKLILIKNVKKEFQQLNYDRDLSKLELERCLNMIKDCSSEIAKLKYKWYNDKEIFKNESEQKMGVLVYPVFGTISLFGTVILGYIFGRENGKSIFNYVFSMGIGLFYFVMGSEHFLRMHDIYFNYQNKHKNKITNKLRNYVFKKDPSLENMYNDIILLEDQISNKEKQLEQLKTEREELEIRYKNICNVLSIKKEEFFKLIGECFETFVDNNIIDENNRETDSEILGKGKIRVKVYEDR